ncbi:MAG TPA: BTAD domain-containing putative transcriptional regulator [Rugosimonospora sp.]
MVRIRLLGPVDVIVHDTPYAVPGLRRKAVLVALALQPGQIVHVDRLIDIVWGDAAPATAANTLQAHISQLRRLLGGRHTIQSRPPGYVLDVGAEATDLEQAERLLREGTQAADPVDGVALVRAAVSLWRGAPLADLAELPWFGDHARRLEHLLLHARQTLVEARLALGEHTALVPELEALSRQHPLHEQIHRQLMLALYRSGRQVDALAAYQRLRQALGEDLGIDPSRALRDLETAILRQDHVLDAPAPAHPPVSVTVPAQLPLAGASFTGRGEELARLDALLAGAAGGPTAGAGGGVTAGGGPTAGGGVTGGGEAAAGASGADAAGPAGPAAVAVCAMSGTAGIGKPDPRF